MKTPGNGLPFLPSPLLEKIEKKMATVRFTRNSERARPLRASLKPFENILKPITHSVVSTETNIAKKWFSKA